MFQLWINDEVPDGGVIAFVLRDVLHALGPEALDWIWIVSGVGAEGEKITATGNGAADLQALERSGAEVSGSHLAEIANRTDQVIWGEFRAFRDNQRESPWV